VELGGAAGALGAVPAAGCSTLGGGLGATDGASATAAVAGGAATVGLLAPSPSTLGVAAGAVPAWAGAAARALAALAAVFFAGGGSLASFSLSRRSTGASTVEEADRTNSPMSFSRLRTVLLSTPSSFASS
jgi:hypothetical protein